ncbi:family 43 glycosylhydrolase [Nannocystis bainbridge]|uniref:Family 43 glycosylhydrolase n=1 Tax=Nannocystis bainbridge TaxID=2995303 RepID=A0ABT5DVT2_9BACT|nr:family 43 glycosylhydrolase [Nannocystis bainbridge]MDC0716823.1 family 43 glycosylhydrolase [Nannocystis bainbridge]
MHPRSFAALAPVFTVLACSDAGSSTSAATADTTTSTGAATDAQTGTAETEPTTTTGRPTEASTSETSETSETSDSSTSEPPPPVNGLRAEYFATYIDPVMTRIDPGLDFVWGLDAPDPSLPVDRHSIRWTGSLLAPATGTYTIITETDDGVRVWVDDALVIDDWIPHFVTRNEASVELTAGVPAAIRVDYFEIDIEASARLLWSSDAIAEQVIPLDNLLAAEPPAELRPPKPPYGNPVIPFDCPDPGVLGVEQPDGPHFYMVCTGGSFPIRHSRDLVLWNDTGAAVLPNGKPAWAANGNRNWAPELHRVGGKYMAYFTTVNGGNVLSIGAAYADDPLGPYTERPGPLVEHPLGVIDASFYEDAGVPYLTYKIDGNSQGQPTPIFIRQLTPDGLDFADEPVQILTNDPNSWEGGVVEAQWIVRRDDYYYLLYSGNVYDHRYRTGVARSASLLGPYEKLGPPILVNNDRWVGPGHGTLLPVGGLDYFVYHAWTNAGNGTQDGGKGRTVLVDRVWWENGWPRIHDGSPSGSLQTWPGEP